MKSEVMIRITEPSLSKVGIDELVYSNTVFFDDSFGFPYQKFLEVFSMIYDRPGTVIHFSNFVHL